MAIYAKTDAGIWADRLPYVRDGGLHKLPSKGYVRDADVWKPFYVQSWLTEWETTYLTSQNTTKTRATGGTILTSWNTSHSTKRQTHKQTFHVTEVSGGFGSRTTFYYTYYDATFSTSYLTSRTTTGSKNTSYIDVTSWNTSHMTSAMTGPN